MPTKPTSVQTQEPEPRLKSAGLMLRVSEARLAARDIRLLRLIGSDGNTLPPSAPGAHIDLHLPCGTRQYSLLTPEAAPRAYAIVVKHDAQGRGGSRYLHNDIGVGDELRASMPRNTFALIDDAPHTVLIAGGIGVTPLWAMAQRLDQLGRSWNMHYACRQEHALIPDVRESLRSRVRTYFSDERSNERLDLNRIVATMPPGAHVYCCGPASMMDAFARATRGLPSHRVHSEYFTGRPPPFSEQHGFDVELARSGRSLRVEPGQSILEALLAAGIDATYSCEEGICGACETSVIAGTPIHRDHVLSPEERSANASMMICCSGCRGDRLVLDM